MLQTISNAYINQYRLTLWFCYYIIYDFKSDVSNYVNSTWPPEGQNDGSKQLIWRQAILSVSNSPKKDAQDVGYKQHQTNSGGEAFCVAAQLDLLVLWEIRQGPPKHHEAGGQPGQQHPWALGVLLLQNHIRIHHSESPGDLEAAP